MPTGSNASQSPIVEKSRTYVGLQHILSDAAAPDDSEFGRIDFQVPLMAR